MQGLAQSVRFRSGPVSIWSGSDLARTEKFFQKSKTIERTSEPSKILGITDRTGPLKLLLALDRTEILPNPGSVDIKMNETNMQLPFNQTTNLRQLSYNHFLHHEMQSLLPYLIIFLATIPSRIVLSFYK